MKKVALSEVKDDLSKYLRTAEEQDVVITRHGKPAGVLVGFASEDDWFDYRLEHDPRFLQRIEQARQSLRTGNGVKLDDISGTKRRRRKGRTGATDPVKRDGGPVGGPVILDVGVLECVLVDFELSTFRFDDDRSRTSATRCI